ncbi:MAG: LamG domain-containing protein, partial [Planctomycetota bacterium]
PNVLSWTPPAVAAYHDVYYGSDYESVRDANISYDPNEVYMGRFDSNFWPVGGNTLSLELGNIYYWRIDEVNGSEIWKGSVWSFRTKFEIIDEHLLLWYTYDEGRGEWVYDYSGHELHSFDSSINPDNWDADGRFDYCLHFKDDVGLELPKYPERVLTNIDDEITVSMWLNGQPQEEFRDNWVIDAGGGDYYLRVMVPDEAGNVFWRAGNDSNDALTWEVDTWLWQNEWHHFAFVKDESADKMYIYFDGAVGWWKPGGTTSSLTNLADKQFKIGAKLTHSSDYEGKMDDLRIYDYAKSESEIKELYRGGDLASAWGPSPYDGQGDASRDANLAWNAGDFADSHDVYFGTDYAAVRDANTAVTFGVFKDNQSGTTYDLETLTLDKTYFWRIDEVNDSNGFKWPGKVWRFKVADYIIIDDFEFYEDSGHLRTEWIIWGGDDEFLTGARLYLANYSVLYPAHGGSQIMRYGYYTDIMNPPPGSYQEVDYAEAYLSFTGGRQNWKDSGVRALTLFFYGLPANATTEKEQMYVGIEDTGGTYAEIRYGDYEQLEEEDINDLNEPEWHRWFIALPDFNDSNYAAVPDNVDLSSVAKLYIGFGNRRSPQAGGSGEVRFDDIRLNLPVCRADVIKPVGDFTGPRGVPDCVVDLADIGYIADEWLKSDANLVDMMDDEPCDSNLLGHWKLDGDPCDSSSYNHYGSIDGDGSDYSWVTGYDGEESNPALEFTGTCRLLVPDDNNTPALRPKYRVSVSAWAYSKGQSDSARVVVKGQDDKETYSTEVSGDDDFTFLIRDANNNKYDVSTQVPQDEWMHLAGTYDGNVVKCYVNADLRKTTDANFVVVKGWTLSQDQSGLAIGNRSDATNRQFRGIVDDVRIYDYALSVGEIAWLATDGEGYMALNSQANLYDLEKQGEKYINLRDLAVLIDEHWLDEILWP